MRVQFTKKFQKQYKRSPSKIQRIFGSKLKIFMLNPLDASLNNHQLSGKLCSYRSISVTGDWRVIYSLRRGTDSDGVIVVFELIGTHSQLYG